jgi:hypothetical protein
MAHRGFRPCCASPRQSRGPAGVGESSQSTRVPDPRPAPARSPPSTNVQHSQIRRLLPLLAFACRTSSFHFLMGPKYAWGKRLCQNANSFWRCLLRLDRGGNWQRRGLLPASGRCRVLLASSATRSIAWLLRSPPAPAQDAVVWMPGVSADGRRQRSAPLCHEKFLKCYSLGRSNPKTKCRVQLLCCQNPVAPTETARQSCHIHGD